MGIIFSLNYYLPYSSCLSNWSFLWSKISYVIPEKQNILKVFLKFHRYNYNSLYRFSFLNKKIIYA